MTVAICLSVFQSVPAVAQEGSGREVPSPGGAGPSVGAATAILVDARDGRTLWSKSPHERRGIASTTKIVTALVVLEKSRPGDRVTASARAEAVGLTDPLVTELDLTRGETLTVEQLLYGLLMISANDAAMALAEHAGGSENGFVKLMNDKARKMGARNTRFANANGSDAPGHYSTANDLALFARQAMEVPLIRKIVATRRHSVPGGGRTGGRVLENRNQLLGRFAGANGIKTGQTAAAGKSLVASAKRGSEERISVVLASADPISDSERLLGYGFSAFRRFDLAQRDRMWGQVTYGDGTTANLVALEDAGILLPRTEPRPRVWYDARNGVVKADVAGLQAAVRARCEVRACNLPPDPPPRPLAGLFSMLKPVLSLAR